MNRRPPSFLPLSKAAVGFLQYKTTEGLSPNTLKRYQQFLRLWLEFAGDVPIHRIKTDDVRLALTQRGQILAIRRLHGHVPVFGNMYHEETTRFGNLFSESIRSQL